jgi:hypothetical protein
MSPLPYPGQVTALTMSCTREVRPRLEVRGTISGKKRYICTISADSRDKLLSVGQELYQEAGTCLDMCWVARWCSCIHIGWPVSGIHML